MRGRDRIMADVVCYQKLRLRLILTALGVIERFKTGVKQFNLYFGLEHPNLLEIATECAQHDNILHGNSQIGRLV